MESNIVKSVRVNELLKNMMESDMNLYEKILDTSGFSYAFNELCKLAQNECPNSPPTYTAEEVLLKKFHSTDPFLAKKSIIDCMQEYADIRTRQEREKVKKLEGRIENLLAQVIITRERARNEAIQECIEKLKDLDEGPLFYINPLVLKELEKLKR